MFKKKITSPEEYSKITSKQNTRKLKLPSGAIFIIRKISPLELLRDNKNLPFMDKSEFYLDKEEKAEALAGKKTIEDQVAEIDMTDYLFTKAVVSPEISIEKEEGKLHISVLRQNVKDYNALDNAIYNYSMGYLLADKLKKKSIT